MTGQKHLKPRPGDLSYANLTKKKSRLCNSEHWKVLSEDGDDRPVISFCHNVTGTRVSSLGIIDDGDLGDAGQERWKEIKTDDRKLKIMCFDENIILSSRS